MALEEVLNLVSKAAKQQGQLNREEKRYAEEARRKRQLEKRRVAHFKGRRITLALDGIVAVGVIGASAEMQELIKEQGHPFVLWGKAQKRTAGYDMSDIYWRTTSRVMLTASAVLVENYSDTSSDYGNTFRPDIGERYVLEFPYGGLEPAWRKRLSPMASLKQYDLQEVRDLMYCDKESDITYSPEVLFDVLVQCSNQATLEELVLQALSE